MGFSMVSNGDRYDILSGKKQIGRVCQHADGSWVGVAGRYIIVRGCHSPKGAFNETVARWLRYDMESPKRSSSKKKSTARIVTKTEPQAPVVRTEFRATTAQMRPRNVNIAA